MKTVIEVATLWNCVCFVLTQYVQYGVPPEIAQPKWSLQPCHSTFRIPRTTATMIQNWITYIYEANPYRIEDECMFVFEGDPNQHLAFQLKDLRIYLNETYPSECLSLYNTKDDGSINIFVKFCVSDGNINNTGEFVYEMDANVGIITTTIKYGYFQIAVQSISESSQNHTTMNTTTTSSTTEMITSSTEPDMITNTTTTSPENHTSHLLL